MGRTSKFCPQAGKFVEKMQQEIQNETNMADDELSLREMKSMADSIMQNIETEYDCPSVHPELDFKVPVLDLAMWVDDVPTSAGGLDGLEIQIHANCSRDEPCLPIGTPPCAPPHSVSDRR